MQFIKPNVLIEPQPSGIDGMLKHIELCGRVSYKSEDRITTESCDKFLKMLINRGHSSPLEHGTVYLTIPENTPSGISRPFFEDPYSTVLTIDGNLYITTNYRVIVQHKLEDAMKQYWSEPTLHEKRITIRVICSRGVSHELVRHRGLSFTQESTRYCNYSKDKYDNCVSFIIPSWLTDIKDGEKFTTADIAIDKVIKATISGKRSGKTMVLISNHICAESAYMELLKQGCTPQEARDVLPNGLKTELVITGTVNQWIHFLSLRSPAFGATGVHPDAAVIGDKVYAELVSAGYLTEKKND